MKRFQLHVLVPLLAAFAAPLMAAACSSDEDNGGNGGSGGSESDPDAGRMDKGGSGGASGSGGSTASGGMMASGGAAGSGGGGEDLYTCFANQVEEPDPGGSGAEGADCCEGFGACTSEDDVDESARSSFGHDSCDADESLLCAPKDPAELPLPEGGLPTCSATYGDLVLEGRCLPRCFTLGNPSAASLDQGDCSEALATALGFDLEDVVCAPCYSPIDGSNTGACEQFGDMPQEAAPDPFEECGSYMEGPNAGYCVPEALIENISSSVEILPQDTCSTGYRCAPKNKVEDPNSCFAKCTPMLGGPDGACVATYIVEGRMEGTAALLGQDTCEDGETCAPCLDPLVTTEPTPTGACEN